MELEIGVVGGEEDGVDNEVNEKLYTTAGDALRTVETMVRLMNSGLFNRTSCGEPPLTSGTPAVVANLLGETPAQVTVSWNKSGDDGVREKDIERYAVFRRLSSATVFGDPIVSIPATMINNYSYTDFGVVQGQTYVYGIAAQDCTPLLSAVSSSVAVSVP